MAVNYIALSKATSFLSTAGSLAASVVLLRTVVNDFLPHEVQEFFYAGVRKLLGDFSSEFTVVVHEYDGFFVNEIYEAARTYLAGRTSRSTRRVNASKQQDENYILVTVEPGEEVVDVFEGVQFRWRLALVVGRRQSSQDAEDGGQPEKRFFELAFPRKNKDKALGSYLSYIMATSKAMRAGEKAIKLHMLRGGYWNSSVNLDHPATFDTLAMDPELKRTLMEDLTNFLNSKDYYRRTGKAWKRGYLLYGPPGTGKSSLVAAMANFLRFDVYDLELTEVHSNVGLRELLVATAKRSILVIEDIDCSIDVCSRKRAVGSHKAEAPNDNAPNDDIGVTLSGLLNFMDGLWSSCGEERIIVVTTNHKERLDPALLRPGRMDVHIHMSYCSAPAFRKLASNYHGVDEHPLFEEIEGLMQEVEVTPAVVVGELMKSVHREIALQGLLSFLHEKKKKKKARATEGVAEGEDASATCVQDRSEVVEIDEHPNTRSRKRRRPQKTMRSRGSVRQVMRRSGRFM
ncbi:hypothetical protein Taro_009039 [Colocasia esculenta]|uniref:AAA+ ATPase domain-containing protein n=1 Tax=Colocasia esculenta TaxID=4460 RepID=A0A843U3P9_COLES|nr:hypothetical protein [Colocasia esculenta]